MLVADGRPPPAPSVARPPENLVDDRCLVRGARKRLRPRRLRKKHVRAQKLQTIRTTRYLDLFPDGGECSVWTRRRWPPPR